MPCWRCWASGFRAGRWPGCWGRNRRACRPLPEPCSGWGCGPLSQRWPRPRGCTRWCGCCLWRGSPASSQCGDHPGPDNARALVQGRVLACLHRRVRAAQCPRRGKAPWNLNHDFFWNLGNAQSFLQAAAPGPAFSGYTITYHWLSSCWPRLCHGRCSPVGRAGLTCRCSVCGCWRPCWPSAGPCGLKAGKKPLCFLCSPSCAGGAGLWKIFSYGRCPFWNLSVYHLISNVNGMGLTTLLLAGFAAGVWSAVERPQTLAVGLHRGGLRPAVLCQGGPVAGVAALAFALAALVRLPLPAQSKTVPCWPLRRCCWPGSRCCFGCFLRGCFQQDRVFAVRHPGKIVFYQFCGAAAGQKPPAGRGVRRCSCWPRPCASPRRPRRCFWRGRGGRAPSAQAGRAAPVFHRLRCGRLCGLFSCLTTNP